MMHKVKYFLIALYIYGQVSFNKFCFHVKN